MAGEQDFEDEEIQSLLQDDPHEGEGDDAAEQGEDGAEGGDDEGVEPQAEKDEDAGSARVEERQRTRQGASGTIRELRERAQREETARQNLERQMQELLARTPQPQQETPQQEAERLALMTSEERMDYKLEKAQRQHQQQLQLLQRQHADAIDKQAFQQKVSGNKLVARFADQVEKELDAIRRQGGNVDRERLAHYLIGKAMAEKAAKDISVQKAQGARNVRQQTVRAGSSRSDVAGSGRRESNDASALHRRMENRFI
jgi:flagellar biosynthesis GTPase FlhF